MTHLAQNPNASDRRFLARVDDAWYGVAKGTLPLDPDDAVYDVELAHAAFAMRSVVVSAAGAVLEEADVTLRIAQALDVLLNGRGGDDR